MVHRPLAVTLVLGVGLALGCQSEPASPVGSFDSSFDIHTPSNSGVRDAQPHDEGQRDRHTDWDDWGTMRTDEF